MSKRGENIYKRKDGRWECRQKKADGKYRYIYAKTYRELREKRDTPQCGAKLSEKSAGVCAGVSTGNLFEQWLVNDAAGRVKPSTYESYYLCMRNYVIPFFRDSCEGAITEQQVGQFVRVISENALLSEAYKKKLLSIFKTALKDILRDRPDYNEVIREIKLPKLQSPEIQVFTVSEQTRIERAALEYSDRRALGILLCFYTGIRLGELCGLRWGDIDMEMGTMAISRTVTRTKNFEPEQDKTKLLIGTPKSQNSMRKIPVPDFLLKLAGEEPDRLCEKNFILTAAETPLDPRSYQKLYKKVLDCAGVKSRKFHAIRHTFATRALELGIDIKTLSEIMGHSNVSITMNIYAHSLMEQKRIAIERLNSMHLDHMNKAPIAVTNSVSLS